MNTLNQVFLLNNINFIFTTTIMFMIIFIYSLERRSRYISFLIIYSIELILFLSFKQNFFNSYSINIAVIFIVKILWVILNLNSIRANRLKKIELISINILGLLVINESILLAFCINLLVNFSVFYNIVYKMLYKISKNLVYIEGKNKKLKKQYVRTGQTLYSTYIEVKEGVSETDWIAFPYGKAVKEGAPVQELEGSVFADQLY